MSSEDREIINNQLCTNSGPDRPSVVHKISCFKTCYKQVENKSDATLTVKVAVLSFKSHSNGGFE